MVKIPNLEDLKKMGTGLIDSAKNVKFGEMMDKVKTGIENVSGKGGGNIPQGDDAIKTVFEGLNTSIKELIDMQSTQLTAAKKIQSQLSDLGRVINATQKAGEPAVPSSGQAEPTAPSAQPTNESEDNKQ